MASFYWNHSIFTHRFSRISFWPHNLWPTVLYAPTYIFHVFFYVVHLFVGDRKCRRYAGAVRLELLYHLLEVDYLILDARGLSLVVCDGLPEYPRILIVQRYSGTAPPPLGRTTVH